MPAATQEGAFVECWADRPSVRDRAQRDSPMRDLWRG